MLGAGRFSFMVLIALEACTGIAHAGLLFFVILRKRLRLGLWRGGWFEPQAGVGGLEGGVYNFYQVGAQPAQLYLVADRAAEGGDGLGRVVAAAVEAAVYEALDSAAQGDEQRGDGQGGDDRHQLILALLRDGAEDILQYDHADGVGQRQQRGEQRI